VHAGLYFTFLFAIGLLLGYVWPKRPWQWGLATVVLLPLMDFRIAEPLNSLVFLLVTLPFSMLFLVPVPLIGSYLGAIAARRRSAVPWLAVRALGIGLASSTAVSYLLLLLWPAAEIPQLAPFWATAAFLIAGAATFWRPGLSWRWALAVGLGSVLAVAVDIMVDPTSHSLAPFEIALAMPVGFVPAFAGVFVAKLFRGAAAENLRS
jgi:hypothetical protein